MIRASSFIIACVQVIFSATLSAAATHETPEYVVSPEVVQFVEQNAQFGVRHTPPADRILCPTCITEGRGAHELVRSEGFKELYGSWCVVCDAKEWDARVMDRMSKKLAKIGLREKRLKKERADLRIAMLKRGYEASSKSALKQQEECSLKKSRSG
jgi:hypothetical protein